MTAPRATVVTTDGPVAPADGAWTWPAEASARDRLVVALRRDRVAHDPWRHQGAFVEDEPTAGGDIARVATILMTSRECPWRCAMCDLWRYTNPGDTPLGATPRQVREALGELRAAGEVPTHVKLYNGGSFFDERAVPPADYDAVAAALGGIEHVIVESHPALVGGAVDRWLAALARSEGPTPTLEVAMGLETAHPAALEQLNKRMTVERFVRAVGDLRDRGVATRVFLLVHPPFVPVTEREAWLVRSVAVAFEAGATAVSLIPTRAGNGTVEPLVESGALTLPTLADLERAFDAAIAIARGRVFADLWDVERLASCPACLAARRDRLARANLLQQALPGVACDRCGGGR